MTVNAKKNSNKVLENQSQQGVYKNYTWPSIYSRIYLRNSRMAQHSKIMSADYQKQHFILKSCVILIDKHNSEGSEYFDCDNDEESEYE